MGLKEFFELDKYKTSVATEILAGVTTFLTMAYIILVNPTILYLGGMPFGPVIIATILSAGIFTILTGLYAKKPFAMAPYMGENALFAFAIVPMIIAMGIGQPDAWKIALGAVFWGGVIFFIVSITGARAVMAKAVPSYVALSWAVGIGLFLMFIGFAAAGISLPGIATPVRLGRLYDKASIVAIVGTIITMGLYVKKVPGSLLIGIIITMILAYVVGIPAVKGEAIAFPNWSEILLQLDFIRPWTIIPIIPIIVLLFLVDIFDTLGTVAGLAAKAGYVDEKGRVAGVEKVFHVDALATMIGALFGTSTTGTYIESAAGIEMGGRTGLTAVVTGLLFLVTLPLVPLIAILDPSFLQLACAPALIVVGILMLSALKRIDFDDPVQAVPAALTVAFMVFTYNITLGIAASLVAYPLVATAVGRHKEVHPVAWLLALLSFILFIFYPYG